MEVRIVSSALDPGQLRRLVDSASAPIAGQIEIRDPASGFIEGLDAELLVALLPAATTVGVTLIKCLFDLWLARRRARSEDGRPVLVVVTTTLRLRIASEQDLPDEDELAGETIEEVRLALEA